MTDRRRPTAPMTPADRLIGHVRRELSHVEPHVIEKAIQAAREEYADGARSMQGALDCAHAIAQRCATEKRSAA